MLNIENYEQWSKVCDDDELISDLYDSGIRPGTDEFKDLLGEPCQGDPASFKEVAPVVLCFGIFTLSIIGSVKLIKLAIKKVKQFINKKITKQGEEP